MYLIHFRCFLKKQYMHMVRKMNTDFELDQGIKLITQLQCRVKSTTATRPNIF